MSITATIYNDGVKISFKLLALEDFQFKMLMDAIKRNKEKLTIADLLLDKNDFTHISFAKMDRKLSSEFLQVLECETLISINRSHVNTPIPLPIIPEETEEIEETENNP